MAWCHQATSHYLSQCCWLIINENLGNMSEWIFNNYVKWFQGSHKNFRKNFHDFSMTFDDFSKFHDFPCLFQKTVFFQVFQVFQTLWEPWIWLMKCKATILFSKWQYDILSRTNLHFRTEISKPVSGLGFGAWIQNHMHGIQWDVITHSCFNFQHETTDVITYPCSNPS